MLFSLVHPRREFVTQLNLCRLSQPDRAVVEGAALTGVDVPSLRRLAEIENAIACATAYWNDHRHPFIWGRRRRHRQSQRLSIAAAPNLTLI